MADLEKQCHFCQNKGVNLKRCTRCMHAYYCSKVCQSLEWPAHRQVCRKQTKFIETQQTRKHRRPDDHIEESTEEYSEKNENETNPIYDENEARRVEQRKHVLDQESAKGDNGDDKIVADVAITVPDQNASGRQRGEACTQCGVTGHSKRCSRCKTVYCSHECQRKDWPMHKKTCIEDISEDDKRITRTYLEQKKDTENIEAELLKLKRERTFMWQAKNYAGSFDRIYQTLTYEQAMLRARRPDGSLKVAVTMAKEDFPGFEIITKFAEVPDEQWNLFMASLFRRARRNMLVAFMYRYHDHVMRHGVYIKDEEDEISKVEFYLDQYLDNPMPFFSYQQVKPGGYICLMDPEMHVFGDGTVGIRMNHPHQVVILNV